MSRDLCLSTKKGKSAEGNSVHMKKRFYFSSYNLKSLSFTRYFNVWVFCFVAYVRIHCYFYTTLIP